MSETAKAKRFIQENIYGAKAQDDNSFVETIEAIEEKDRKREPLPNGGRRQSAYVTAFEDMVNNVHEHESHLLSQNELDALDAFSRLCYNSRYCLIRMALLKAGRWQPIGAFEKWKSEVGENGLLPSIEPLCKPIKELLELPPSPVKKEEEVDQPLPGPEIIDLTESDDEDSEKQGPQPVAGPSRLPEPQDPIDDILKGSYRAELDLSWLCQDDRYMSLYELLDRLNVDQLKELAKLNKCSVKGPGVKKSDIVHALLTNATTQGVLNFAKKDVKGKGKAPDAFRQTQLPFAMASKKGGTQSQERRLRNQILTKYLKKCFRVNPDFLKLVRRVHVIAFRCTEHPSHLMLPALLQIFKKRNYAQYKHERDADIWPSRIELIQYEEAMELERHLDELLESKPEEAAREATVPLKTRVTPATTLRQTPRKTPTKPPVNTPIKTRRGPTPQEMFWPEEDDMDVDLEPPPDDASTVKFRKIAQHIEDWILERWQVQVEFKRERNAGRTPALQRFEPGYIYSRMLRKALASLGRLKEHQREFDIIEKMLQQRLFLRGKRAKLYERRAILQEKYLSKSIVGNRGQIILQNALEGVREALRDDDTVLVLRPSLVRRLRRLEKKLKVPETERVVVEGELRTAEEVEVFAKRIFHSESSLKLDALGKPIRNKENITRYLNSGATGSNLPTAAGKKQNSFPKMGGRKHTGKSIWQGRNAEEVNVEQRALQYYEDQGFKGFHAETSILTTLFGLLFWDIMFADIRGAFETEFQAAPLDIVDDSFYYARQNLIETRLEELRQGKAVEVLSRHYDQHVEKKTWCIGVRWDICEKQDLVEILECLGGRAIASVCRLFCEDYTGRCSGAPDLIVWNAQARICKFVEVKGPGDTPQENQKLWFDSLLVAGIAVELCKVFDVNDPKSHTTNQPKGRSSKPKGTAQKRKRGKHKLESETEEQDYDKLDPESEDEIPEPPTKTRRTTDPGPIAKQIPCPPTPVSAPLRSRP